MSEPVGVSPTSADIKASTYQEELRKGFPALRFARPIESQFREAFVAQHIGRMRIGFAVAFVLYAIFTLVRFPAESGVAGAWGLKLRAGLLAAMLLTLLASFVRRIAKWVPALSFATYVVFGIAATGIEIIARRYGLERHYESLILVSFHVYVFSGLLFRPAVIAGAAIFLSYLIGGAVGGLAGREWAYQLLFIALTNVLGVSALFAIERVERDSFLRRSLLVLLATRDTLTGLYNRGAFFSEFQRTVRQAARERVAIAVVLLDIDHFKSYNDHYGHLEGDACLRSVADAINQNFKRAMDVVGRYGGEEFVGVWYDAQANSVRELGEQLRASVQALKIPHDKAPSGRVTISVGAVACVPQDGESLQALIHRADTALYAAKDKGRNRVVVEILPSTPSAAAPSGRRAPTVSAG